MTECYTCRQNSVDPTNLPPREAIYGDGIWRAAHAFSSALAGWTVVLPRRHVTSLSQLTEEEAASLGPLLSRLSSAVEAVTGASKCYVVFLAEAPGFEHLHIHVIPRLSDIPADRTGIDVMKYLTQPESEWIPQAEMDRISLEIQQQMASES